MKQLINRYKLVIIGSLLGMLSGFLYWKYVGCNSGTCMITSRPLNSTLYGTVLGGLIFSFFSSAKTKNK